MPTKCSKTVTRNVFPSWVEKTHTENYKVKSLFVIPVCSVCCAKQNQARKDKRFTSNSCILMKIPNNALLPEHNTKLHLQMLTCTWIVSCSYWDGFQESTWLSLKHVNLKNTTWTDSKVSSFLKPHLDVADTVTHHQALMQGFCNNTRTDLRSTHTCFSQSQSLMLFKKKYKNLSVCLLLFRFLVHQPLLTVLETTHQGVAQSFPLTDHWWDSGMQIFLGA